MSQRRGFTQHHFFETVQKFSLRKWAKKSGAGYTMIELLVTIGLLTAIAGLALPAFGAMQRTVALNSAVQELADAVHISQTRAISSHGGLHHGLRFEANQIVLIEQDPATGIPTNAGTRSIIGEISDCLNCTVMFTKLTGMTNLVLPQEIGITVSGREKKVKIEPNGQISLL